jgi:ComF family protein
VPVPLHLSRERERGYNQSALLAKELSRLTGIPLATDLLRRTIDTAPQVTMDDYEQRRSNIAGAFECIGDPSGLNVLLVDDVITTGSTMSACAAPLKSQGAARVWGLALAR